LNIQQHHQDRISLSRKTAKWFLAAMALPIAWQPALGATIETTEQAQPARLTAATPLPICNLPTAGQGTARIEPGLCADWSLGDDTPARFADPQPPEPAYGPPAPDTIALTQTGDRHASFGEQVGSIKWEVAAIFGYMTAAQTISLLNTETSSFHTQNEGWFGKNTKALGMDKITHAFNAYVIADFLQHRIEKRTGAKGAVTAAAIASGLQLYGEFFDAHKVDSGFGWQDIVFNMGGAGFSVLRNSVPGLREKLDFRLMLVPNSEIYTFKGQRHYAQQRYLFALTLAGFDRFKDSPLRFVELHAGYYAKDFTTKDVRAGKSPTRRILFGVGLNVKELLFRSPRSEVGKMANSGLDYIQIPYTAAHGHSDF